MALGQLYEQGSGGTPQDLSKALAYYSYAADQMEPYAYYKIGVFLEEGWHPECIEGKPNREMAFQYFKEA